MRVQARSATHPELDGAWFRAFDYGKWEAWASDADIGWGAWSVESGWSQSWLSITLGMRLLNTSLWELGGRLDGIKDDFDALIPPMFWQPPPPPAPCLPPPPSPSPTPAAAGAPVEFNFTTFDHALCARPAPAGSTVAYRGVLCGPAGPGMQIRWEAMATVDPRPGLQPAQCEWSAAKDPADVPTYIGTCGVQPTKVPLLPTHLCAE